MNWRPAFSGAMNRESVNIQNSRNWLFDKSMPVLLSEMTIGRYRAAFRCGRDHSDELSDRTIPPAVSAWNVM